MTHRVLNVAYTVAVASQRVLVSVLHSSALKTVLITRTEHMYG